MSCSHPIPALDLGIDVKGYEINKQIISQLPNLDKAGYQEAKRKIRHYINSNTNTYYMLLCSFSYKIQGKCQ